MNRKVLIFGGIGCTALALLCIVVGAIAFLGGLAATQPSADVGEKFMAALRDADYTAAYNLMHPALQQKIGQVADLQQMIEGGNVQPTKWSFNSRSTSGDEGQLDGSVSFSGNRQGVVHLDLAKSGNDWKVIGFNLKEQ